MMRIFGPRAIVMLSTSILLGCSGPVVNVAPVPPTSYSEVGNTSGEACGMILLWMIPIAVNDRVELAYTRAVEHAHATSLTDTTVTESWYFALVGTAVCTQVEGLALRKADGPSLSPRAPRGELKLNSH